MLTERRIKLPTFAAAFPDSQSWREAYDALRKEHYELLKAIKLHFDVLNSPNALKITHATGSFSDLAVTDSSTFPSGSTTPTVTSQGGTITTSTASLVWWDVGAYTNFEARITVTTIGTATGQLRFTLPTTPSADGTGCGVEFAVNGKQVSLTLQSGVAYAAISYYDATTPFSANGVSFQVSGRYKR
jgi:hypothetical protein